MAEIPGYGNRDKALTALESQKTAIILTITQTGYDQLKAEIDRIFPAPAPVITKTPEEKGREAGALWGETFRQWPEAYLEMWQKPVVTAVEFFKGLFGR